MSKKSCPFLNVEYAYKNGLHGHTVSNIRQSLILVPIMVEFFVIVETHMFTKSKQYNCCYSKESWHFYQKKMLRTYEGKHIQIVTALNLNNLMLYTNQMNNLLMNMLYL